MHIYCRENLIMEAGAGMSTQISDPIDITLWHKFRLMEPR